MSTGDQSAEAARSVLGDVLDDSWDVQYGRWVPSSEPAQRYAVVRPVGGPNRTLVRNPILTVIFIGAVEDTPGAVRLAAEAFIKKVIGLPNQPQAIPGVASMETSEPTFSQTVEGRVSFEIVVNCTLSL